MKDESEWPPHDAISTPLPNSAQGDPMEGLKSIRRKLIAEGKAISAEEMVRSIREMREERTQQILCAAGLDQ